MFYFSLKGGNIVANGTRTDKRRLIVGERVKECRKILGITQEELLDKIISLPENNGKTRSQKQLSYIENGTRELSNEYALLLSRALNVRLDYLLLKDDYRTEEDRIAAISSNRSTSFDLILKIMELHNFKISDVTKHTPVLQDEDGNEYQETTFEMKSPRGSIATLSSQELNNTLTLIDSFIDYQCAIKFKKVIDAVNNIYEWKV